MREKKNLSYDKGDTGMQWVKNGLWINNVRSIDIHMEKLYPDLYLTPGTKVNSRLISDLNVKGTIVHILEEKEREKTNTGEVTLRQRVGAYISMDDAFGDPRSTQRALSEATLPHALSSAGSGQHPPSPPLGDKASPVVFPRPSEAA